MRLFKHYIPISIIVLVVLESIIISSSVIISIFIGKIWFYYEKELYLLNVIVIQTFTILVFYVADLYNDININNKKIILSRIIICCVSLFFILSGINFIFEKNIIHFKSLILYFFISTSFVISFRVLYLDIIRKRILKSKILIVGYSRIVKNIYEEIVKCNDIYDLLGVVCDENVKRLNSRENFPIISDIIHIEHVINVYKPDILVIAFSERRGNFPSQVILESKLKGIIIEDATSFYEKITGKILVENLRPSWIIFADGFSKNSMTRIMKRLFDMGLAAVGVCGALPLVIVISILVKLDSFGPIFFRQERVGENGKRFTLVKFRTMVADAEKDTGPVWSQTTDPRVTKLGKLLRRTGMDEIPQLFNVLQGDMSFVGPRPERPHFVTELQEKIPYYTQRLAVKPGITGWAQVRYGYGASLDDAVEKLQYDLYYIKNMSMFLDVLVILSTIHKVIFAKVSVESVSQQHSTSEEAYAMKGVKASEQSFAAVVSDALEARVDDTKIYG